jgi:hypothetical protein
MFGYITCTQEVKLTSHALTKTFLDLPKISTYFRMFSPHPNTKISIYRPRLYIFRLTRSEKLRPTKKRRSFFFLCESSSRSFKLFARGSTFRLPLFSSLSKRSRGRPHFFF